MEMSCLHDEEKGGYLCPQIGQSIQQGIFRRQSGASHPDSVNNTVVYAEDLRVLTVLPTHLHSAVILSD